MVNFIRELREEFRQKFPGIGVRLTGIIMMNQAFPEASQYDMSTLFPLMMLVFIVVLYFWVKGLSGTFSAFMIIVFSIVGAMGLAGWFGIALTPPSFAAIMIIPTMAIADSVHVLMTYVLDMRRGETKHAAMVDSIRVNMQPVFLTSITTAIGFLSMNFSDAPPFHDLGNIVAMGVMIAFALSVTFLPALMMILPDSHRIRETASSTAMANFAEFVIANRKRLLIGMGLGCLLVISFVPKNELNDDFVKYFSEKIEFRRDADFASENLSGLYLVDYSLNSGLDGGVSDPDFQRNLEKFADWYLEQPEVIHVNVLSDTFKRLNKSMHGDDQSWYKLPEQNRRDADFASENLSGLYLVDYSLNSGLDGGVSDPDFQRNLEKFADWYLEQPEVIHVNVLSDTFKRLNKSMHGDDQSWYKLPEQRELAAQYLLLYEMSLPYGLDLNNQINIDKSATRMTVMLYNMTTKTVLALEERAQQWLKDNVQVSMQTEGASPTIMFSNIGERNIKSMLFG